MSDIQALTDHLIKVMEMNPMTRHQERGVLMFLIGGLVRGVDNNGGEVTMAMWMSLLSEGIAQAKMQISD